MYLPYCSCGIAEKNFRACCGEGKIMDTKSQFLGSETAIKSSIECGRMCSVSSECLGFNLKERNGVLQCQQIKVLSSTASICDFVSTEAGCTVYIEVFLFDWDLTSL